MTSAVARVGVVGSTVARFGVVKPAGDFLQPKIQHDLTVDMLPKSQVPKSGRIDPARNTGFLSVVDKVRMPFSKFYYQKSNQCELGLKWDDWYYNEANNKNAMAALSRIDDIDLQLRYFRGLRASQLAIERMVAPEEERWVDMEQEVRYLKPWVNMVAKEESEADRWDSY